MNEITRCHKATDLLIISHLRQDARITLTQMSRQTRIPVSTIFDKIKQFRETGLIRKNTSIVSFEKLGYNTKALVFLSASREERGQLMDILKNSANVNSLFKVNNGWDVTAEIISPSFKEIDW